MRLTPKSHYNSCRAFRARVGEPTLPRPQPRTRSELGRGRPRQARLTDIKGLSEEVRVCWERGERPGIEPFVHRLGPTPVSSEVVELIYLEYCLAKEEGQAPEPSEFLARFPRWREPLSRLLELHDAVPASHIRRLAKESGGSEQDFKYNPLLIVGDEIGPYRLLRVLGEGGFARVFLAEQDDLDKRLIVLKISTRASDEPRLLVRVSHPNVVEVLHVVKAQADRVTLHLVAMSFSGGATLLDFMCELRRQNQHPSSGNDLLALLDRVAAPEYQPTKYLSSSRSRLAGLTYPEAIASLIAQVAHALGNAKRKNVSHGDVKPSNILLTADAVPKLFDFNLSVDNRPPLTNLPPSSSLGGTIGYMAPEALRSLATAYEVSAPLLQHFDRYCADVYSLGLVLRELLTGQPPPVLECKRLLFGELVSEFAIHRTRVSLLTKAEARQIPAGLRTILKRCLEPDPVNRYQAADDLATDLDRWWRGQAPVFVAQASLLRRLKRTLSRVRWLVILFFAKMPA